MTWRRFFNRRRRDEDLQREIASYIALETETSRWDRFVRAVNQVLRPAEE